MSSLIGQTINDRYRLDALLGDGGMGTVFRAFDRNLDRQVAIKLMHSHFARQPEFRRRLIQEAQTAAKLDHPSIVRIYDFGESDLGLFITMEYVDGGSLREHLQRLQSMDKFLPLTQSSANWHSNRRGAGLRPPAWRYPPRCEAGQYYPEAFEPSGRTGRTAVPLSAD